MRSKIPLHYGNLQQSTSVSKEQLQLPLFSSHLKLAVFCCCWGFLIILNVFLWILNSSSATCDWTKSCQWKKQHDISYTFIAKDLCVCETQDSFQRWNYSNLLINKNHWNITLHHHHQPIWGPDANLASIAWRFMGTYGAPKKRRSLGTAKGNLAFRKAWLCPWPWGSNKKAKKKR